MRNEIKIFENSDFGEVRVAGTNEYPLFCLSDVCRVLDIGNASQVKSRIDDDLISNEVIYDSIGRRQEVPFINEDGLYDVIFDSRKPQAKKFRKWITSEVIPSIRKTGFYSTNNSTPYSQPSIMEDTVRSLGAAAEIMQKLFRSSNASAAAYFNKGITQLGLPAIDYVPSKGVKFSATDLLRKFNRSESIYRFNKRMLELGYLEEKTRVSRKSSNGFKKFKSITEKGLEFGENMVNPNNELETQPHYYESKFEELLSILFE